MKRRRKLLIRIFVVTLLVCAYPAFVLGYTWYHVARSDLPGGRHGQLDAYRHALASGVVAFTLGGRTVEWVTRVLEGRGKETNVMDRHNNEIGAGIGSRARSFSEIEPAVYAQVLRGAVNTSDPEQVTWLPRKRWRASRLW